MRRDVAREFKEQIWDANGRIRLDKPWKAEGVTFMESLPEIPTDGEKPQTKRS